MSDIDSKIKEIFSRVDIAANGQISTSCWSEADINLSAPDGMDYWDWIEQATNEAISESNKLTSRLAELEAALGVISSLSGKQPCQYKDHLEDEISLSHDKAMEQVFEISSEALEAVK